MILHFSHEGLILTYKKNARGFTEKSPYSSQIIFSLPFLLSSIPRINTLQSFFCVETPLQLVTAEM